MNAPSITARRLLSRELGGEPGDDAATASDVAAAGERLIARVTHGLSRSFGPYGARALVSRALTRAQASHPVLSMVSLAPIPAIGRAGGAGHEDLIVGLAVAGSAAGTTAVYESVQGWVAQLAALLGGLVGDDLAASLLEQSATNGTADAARRGSIAATRDGDAATPHTMDLDASSTVDEP